MSTHSEAVAATLAAREAKPYTLKELTLNDWRGPLEAFERTVATAALVASYEAHYVTRTSLEVMTARTLELEAELAAERTMVEALESELRTTREQHAKAHDALTKISAIRDSIIGAQTFNWSEHAYPLVAVLDAAGLEGAGYEIAAKNLGTLIEQIKAAESALAAVTGERDALREMLVRVKHGIEDRGWCGPDWAAEWLDEQLALSSQPPPVAGSEEKP
jgi:hypothetical protein